LRIEQFPYGFGNPAISIWFWISGNFHMVLDIRQFPYGFEN